MSRSLTLPARSFRPTIRPFNANFEFVLTSQTQLRDFEQPIDDVIRRMHAIVHELRLVFSADNKERRQLTLRNIDRKLQIHLLAVIECPDRTPGGVIARNLIREVQPLE